MSETNWTINVGSPGIGDVDVGVTTGVAAPPGGQNFIHGHHALTSTPAGFGRYVNNTAGGVFSPMPKGGIVEATLNRFNDAECSMIIYHLLQGTNMANEAYMLGLAPSGKLVLRKGALIDGLPEDIVDPPTNGVLAVSVQTFAINQWVHVQLSAIVQAWGDVDLYVLASDPDVYPVTAPSFQPVQGMDGVDPITGKAFVDDALGINSGSQPFVMNGRSGWVFAHAEQGSRAGIDHVRVAKQL